MQSLLEAPVKLPPKHQQEQAALLSSYKSLYRKWYFQLRHGFGLLMYGFGSKKLLLEDFASSVLTDGAAVVVNGYLQNVKIKKVIFTIADAMWKQTLASGTGSSKRSNLAASEPISSQSTEDLLAFLGSLPDVPFIYVVVHNIDGPGLQDNDTQHIISIVAGCQCVRFVASIDNVNAPLLWSKQMANSKFNWWWHHTPTYAPYSVEGNCLRSLLRAGGTVKTVRTATLVLKSLTPNAQSVFRKLAEFQLSHPEDEGLPLHKLYTSCRELFLVSSELTLRAHLTEFKDHELIVWRRTVDGQDCIHIPLSTDALTKLCEDIRSD